MNRVLLSSISAIIGGSLIYIIEKDFINKLTKRNIKLERIIQNLITELNEKNKKIQNLNKEVNTKPTLKLEIDSSEITTSDSYDSFDSFDSYDNFEEVDQKNDEEEEEADISLGFVESSIVSSSKSESVDISSSVSISSTD